MRSPSDSARTCFHAVRPRNQKSALQGKQILLAALRRTRRNPETSRVLGTPAFAPARARRATRMSIVRRERLLWTTLGFATASVAFLDVRVRPPRARRRRATRENLARFPRDRSIAREPSADPNPPPPRLRPLPPRATLTPRPPRRFRIAALPLELDVHARGQVPVPVPRPGAASGASLARQTAPSRPSASRAQTLFVRSIDRAPSRSRRPSPSIPPPLTRSPRPPSRTYVRSPPRALNPPLFRRTSPCSALARSSPRRAPGTPPSTASSATSSSSSRSEGCEKRAESLPSPVESNRIESNRIESIDPTEDSDSTRKGPPPPWRRLSPTAPPHSWRPSPSSPAARNVARRAEPSEPSSSGVRDERQPRHRHELRSSSAREQRSSERSGVGSRARRRLRRV